MSDCILESLEKIGLQLKLVEGELEGLKIDKKLLEGLLREEKELVDEYRTVAMMWRLRYEQLQDEFELFRSGQL